MFLMSGRNPAGGENAADLTKLRFGDRAQRPGDGATSQAQDLQDSFHAGHPAAAYKDRPADGIDPLLKPAGIPDAPISAGIL